MISFRFSPLVMRRVPGISRVSRLSIIPVVVMVLGLTACDMHRLVDPVLPTDAKEFSPPSVYSTWWNMTQACSGSTGSLGAVTWFKTDKPLHNSETGESINGYWSASSNRIVLTTSAMLDGGIVRHEMLHALVRKPGHPRDQFLGKCAGTVNCLGSCILDAGSYQWPSESPIPVKGDSLDITLDIEPRNPDSAHDGGFFSITVFARNRSTHWITVPNYYAQFFPGLNDTKTFGFVVVGPAGKTEGAEIGFDPSEKVFAPGETKKHVFDFSIGNDFAAHKIPPGSYLVRVGYAYWMSGDSTLVIGP
ncbi:MAG TPA: hypothetical protein VJ840_13315 [Gemmatimonadaceae bacterium]|nr:hypothetical protein [Gemmatimonadaceae bacterium]